MKTERIRTGDDSYTLRVPELDEHYHSIHGARAESMHVFIDAGLKAVKNKPSIHLLEVGLGTGLNCLLTAASQQPETTIRYTALEPFPLEKEILDSIAPENEPERGRFWQIHHTPADGDAQITPGFLLHRSTQKLETLALHDPVDLVYFDAFAPRVQPELWTTEVFRLLYDLMSDNSILVTYCAKGDVRRAMQQAGFQVERLPGPPYKREMLRARKNS